MRIVKAEKVLRHRAPFLFIKEVTVFPDGRGTAEISPHVWRDQEPWRLENKLSALPIEISAQVAGVALRLCRNNSEKAVGYLATVLNYEILLPLAEIVFVEVQLEAPRGAFHPFLAILAHESGAHSATVAGSIFLGAHAEVSRGRVVSQGAGRVGLATATALESVIVRGMDGSESYYAGHFPDQPVTPGVLLLEMAVLAASECAKVEGAKAIELIRVEHVAFQKQVFPGATIEVYADWVRSEGELRIYATRVLHEGRRAMRARIVLRVTM